MKHKTCIHVTSANEATRREPISSVLHGVASCYDGEVKGVGQNAIQLQASSQRNKKKHTYNEALREDVMYGIVSTGVDWVIIKLVTTTGEYNDSDNGNVEVLLSSRTPFAFPINESIESQESLKRVKTENK
uniref:Uncharacterized protein n=1 Tax=Rhizophagus irregularis (strain DAOM 181602 / DAOM 197198 / MUCL 43194) TaxID=747089 RepID=U9SS12_RHIID